MKKIWFWWESPFRLIKKGKFDLSIFSIHIDNAEHYFEVMITILNVVISILYPKDKL